MSPERRVTVVIPTYNRQESLRRCLVGLCDSDLDGIAVDVRVVDDGSIDGTGSMIEELRAGCPPAVRLHYHRQENRGPAEARNRGVDAADTELVLFTDDDCVPDPGWVRALVEHPWPDEVGAVAGQIVSVEAPSRIARYCHRIGYNRFPNGRRVRRWFHFVNTANGAYRCHVFRQLGGFEPVLSAIGYEDVDLARRLMLLGYRMEYEPRAVVHHHHRDTLRGLARAFWKRGASSTLLGVLWKGPAPPTWQSLIGEAWALARSALRLPLLPLTCRRGRWHALGRREALPFAFFDWVSEAARARGTIWMMHRILTGRQPLRRGVPLPPHEGHLYKAFLTALRYHRHRGNPPPWRERTREPEFEDDVRETAEEVGDVT